MKKQSTQIVILTGLVIAAAAIWTWSTPQNPVTRNAVNISSNYTGSDASDLGIRWSKLETSRESEYRGERDIFSDNVPSPQVRRHAPQLPQPIEANQPKVPELPMKFFGYGTVPNGASRRAYLTDGDDVYIVSEGDIILDRYRILKIGNAALEFEEIASQRRGKMMFVEVDSGS